MCEQSRGPHEHSGQRGRSHPLTGSCDRFAGQRRYQRADDRTRGRKGTAQKELRCRSGRLTLRGQIWNEARHDERTQGTDSFSSPPPQRGPSYSSSWRPGPDEDTSGRGAMADSREGSLAVYTGGTDLWSSPSERVNPGGRPSHRKDGTRRDQRHGSC